jgi:hypothetical protein
MKMTQKIKVKAVFDITNKKTKRTTKVELTQEVPTDDDLVLQNVKDEYYHIRSALQLSHNVGMVSNWTTFFVEKLEVTIKDWL